MRSKKGTISHDPEEVARVAEREKFIGYALDRNAIPPDGYTASAMFNMAIRMYDVMGYDQRWLCTMLREWAETIELHNAPVKGKPQ